MSMGSLASVAQRLVPRSIKMKRAAENRSRSRFGVRPGPSRRPSADVDERLLAGLDRQTAPVRGTVSWPGHAVRSVPGCVTEREALQRDGRGARHPRRAVRDAGRIRRGPAGLPAKSILPPPAATDWRRRVWRPSCRRGPGARPTPWPGTVPGAARRGTRPRLAQARTARGRSLRPHTSNAAWAFCAWRAPGSD